MNAETKFIEYSKEVEALLKSVTTKINNRCSENPKNIHWGHVGDLGRIGELLQELDKSLL